MFPPLYDVHLVKASGTCMRLRGFEKPSQRRVVFQEWIIDFHPDGQGRFDMTLDAAVGWAPPSVDKSRQPATVK